MLDASIAMKGSWIARCYDGEGNLKWEEPWDNRIVNEALNYALETTLKGGAQKTSWYIGLTGSDPVPAAGDTMASHSGWSEVTNYSEATRQEWVAGDVAGQSVDNSLSVASFTGDTNGTAVGGAFLVDDSTKGGSTGMLYSIGAFDAGNKTLDANDTLEVTVVLSSSSS